MIEESINFMSGSSWKYVSTLPIFLAIGIVVAEICF